MWALLEITDSSEPDTVPLLNSLLKQGKVEHKDGLFYLKSQAKPWAPNKCPTCKASGVTLSKELEEVHKKYVEVTKDVYEGDCDEWQQEKILPIEAIRKVQVMYNRGDIIDQEIFILGDDDFMSIAIGLTGLAKRITVVEIDTKLIQTIKDISQEHNLGIEIEEYDARNELPEKYKDSFDVFITDPPDAIRAMTAFVSRCVESLRENGSGYLGLTRLEETNADWFEFQKSLQQMNFAITDIIRQFTSYPEAEGEWPESYYKMPLSKKVDFELTKPDLLWYTAALYRVEAVGKPKPLIQGKLDMGSEFYKSDSAWSVAVE